MNIKISTSSKSLSSHGGLVLCNEVLEGIEFKEKIKRCLPPLKIAQSRSFDKFKAMVSGLVAGAECLDDMDYLGQDSTFDGLYHMHTARSYGNFLRSFNQQQTDLLTKELAVFSLDTRHKLFPDAETFTVDIDSTLHRQYAKKMEGVEKAYTGEKSLSSLKIFDEYGFPLFTEVRAGSTYTSQGGAQALHDVFYQVEAHAGLKKLRKYARADSGYCQKDIFHACDSHDVSFVITMRENMFEPIMDQMTDWKKTNVNDPDRLTFYDGRECEVCETVYWPEGYHKALRVVAMRAKQPNDGWSEMLGYEAYDHYAWVTNLGSHEWSVEQIIKFYRKRGNAENFIKELKYGFDLKHFPCQKLSANRVYSVLASFAHAISRYLSLLKSSGRHSHYSKKIRQQCIHLPCEIVRHSRQVIFKFMKHHQKEVTRLVSMIKKHQLLRVNEILGPPGLTGRSLTT
jgi:hypothetical protein